MSLLFNILISFQIPWVKKRKVTKEPKKLSLVPVSAEEMQKIMKGKSMKLVPSQKPPESRD